MTKIHYHVSPKNLGSQVTLKAQIPEGCICSSEGDHPRVCFAPTIAQCLHSVVGGGSRCISIRECINNFLVTKDINGKRLIQYNPTVYMTQQRLVVPPQRRSDFKLTGERWSLQDILVHRVGFIDLDLLWTEQRLAICDNPAPRLNPRLVKAALAEVHKSRNLEIGLKEMQHQRDMLASALGELLVSIGLVSSDVPLTGPDLLLAADTAAAHFKSKDTGKPQ